MIRPFRLSRPAPSAFLADEGAAVSLETAVVLPFLAFVYLQTFTYFDAYRKQAQITKAGYAIGDLLSRQTEIDINDVEGLRTIFGYITQTGDDSWMRVSEFAMQNDSTYRITWSHVTGRNPALTDAYIDRISDALPDIEPSERIVMVETFTKYEPPFNVGLPNRIIESATTTRTRFFGKLDFDDGAPVETRYLNEDVNEGYRQIPADEEET